MRGVPVAKSRYGGVDSARNWLNHRREATPHLMDYVGSDRSLPIRIHCRANELSLEEKEILGLRARNLETDERHS